MTNLARRIAENVDAVRSRIAAAAKKSGRNASDVRLVAVTKYVGHAEIAALVAAGCRDFGESRPQALWQRAETFRGDGVDWHLIGHLQRNKVARTLEHAALLHSVDSERLLATIEAEAARVDRVVDVLLEVNVSGDATKHGVAPAALSLLIEVAATCKHVRTRGLMTMAAREGDAESARVDFARLRTLRDETVAALGSKTTQSVDLTELSMGMSGDFEQAIEAGATIVRVGSALFAGLDTT
jgi:pyridoxal phosphate enzyme (YggS family)